MDQIVDFNREERLKSKKSIDLLFAKGKGISSNPLRLIYYQEESERTLPQVLFSVSKRNFKKAVDRNRIKRQMREIYRLNRDRHFSPEKTNTYLLAFIYIAKEKIPFIILEKKLNLALERLQVSNKGS
ncbi:MAG TPA: ribonuclease P protein component [Cytophagaceae bacterium]|jgi:ribonuclease P protein component|nr:ribonuclease P protein component [Cytophagaceae bacterium]